MKLRLFFDKIGHKRFSIGNNQADIYAIFANFSTLANLLLGVLISLFIVIGNPLHRILTMRLLMLAASFDAIDGRIARMSNTKPRLGAQFDTLADLVSFAFAPAFIILDMYYNLNNNFAFFIAIIYFFSATFRLSKFMLEPTYGYFKGMPSPVAALFIASWYVIEDPDMVLATIAIAFLSALMIVSLPYTGMKTAESIFQRFYFIFTVIMMLLFIFSPNSWFNTLGIIFIIFILYFALVGPLQGYHNINQQKKRMKSENK